MPLFGPVEQKNTAARLVHGTIYAVLTLGSVTMAYPFLLMLGASVTTDIDFEDWRIVPLYLTDDTALFRKWMEDRYGLDYPIAKNIHGFKEGDFRYIEKIPEYGLGDPKAVRHVEEWLDFVKGLPDGMLTAFYIDVKRTRLTNRRYSHFLSELYKGDIAAYNQAHGAAFAKFSEISPFEQRVAHKVRIEENLARKEYLEFRRGLSPEDLMPRLVVDEFHEYVERHIGSLEKLNEKLGMDFASLREVIFPLERPGEGPWREVWDYFVTKRFPLAFLQVEGEYDEAYRTFLAEQYRDYDQRVKAYNAEHGTAFPVLANVRYPKRLPQNDLQFADWVSFTDERVPIEAKRLITVEGLWRERLREKYGTLGAAAEAFGTDWPAWEKVMPPRGAADVYAFEKDKKAIRWEFFFRNYRLVLDYVLLHGRAVFNTFVLVTMTVLGQLTVQPLAAYGLSRFRLRFSHQILLFLLATMAFPKEVAMIPNFLLIKELGLLNTYWALVLPGLASGMGIFLLKGYFDSLPKELYEAAMIDGASEMRMFLQITLPLSKPILAVIALGSFAGAYGGFMWAFLICQKPEMWTMMVFLWQLGQDSYESVWMASLVVAALPTLLVFIFCQKIILRGIIVPTMK